MFRDRDFDVHGALPQQAPALIQDLELDALFDAMAQGDKGLREIARSAILQSLDDPERIRYRQAILRDCLKEPAIIRAIHAIAVEAIEKHKKFFHGLFRDYPSGILWEAVNALQMFVDMLRQLRAIAAEHAGRFQSEGLTSLCALLQRELDDAYFLEIRRHLKHLKSGNALLVSASLGAGNKGHGYVLRKPPEPGGWFRRWFGKKPDGYIVTIHPGDESGSKALSELKDRGINLVANALAQSNDHIESFLDLLKIELGFYVGCLNLHEQLARRGGPVAFPSPADHGEQRLAFDGLYDPSLALRLQAPAVGNGLEADGKLLVLITGANQGGKTSFLRGVGLCQLLMQCGLFVPAASFRASVCDALFTHFKREEDSTMKSGKLDEELERMEGIVSRMTGRAMVLFNESFAATNEREGSEIARQVAGALLEKGVRILFVTYLYEFAHSFQDQRRGGALFLRAGRNDDGSRTYRLAEGEPLPTSFGEDLYRELFSPEREPGAPVRQ
jgi:DNA mismatch repair ATPase MutS